MLISAPIMLIASTALPLMPTPELALLMLAPHIIGAAGITDRGKPAQQHGFGDGTRPVCGQ